MKARSAASSVLLVLRTANCVIVSVDAHANVAQAQLVRTARRDQETSRSAHHLNGTGRSGIVAASVDANGEVQQENFGSIPRHNSRTIRKKIGGKDNSIEEALGFSSLASNQPYSSDDGLSAYGSAGTNGLGDHLSRSGGALSSRGSQMARTRNETGGIPTSLKASVLTSGQGVDSDNVLNHDPVKSGWLSRKPSRGASTGPSGLMQTDLQPLPMELEKIHSPSPVSRSAPRERSVATSVLRQVAVTSTEMSLVIPLLAVLIVSICVALATFAALHPQLWKPLLDLDAADADSQQTQQRSSQRRSITTPNATALWNEDNFSFEAHLEDEDKCYLACKLHKLNDTNFDEPHDQESWRTRDVWIGAQGIIYYYSEKNNRKGTMFDEISIGRLEVKRLEPEASLYPFCFSVGFMPSENPDEDPNPTWFGADCEADLQSVMKAHEHFKDLAKNKDNAVFAAKLMKFSTNTGTNDPLDINNWRARDVWISARGVMMYYSHKDAEIMYFFGRDRTVGELKLEVLKEDETCYPFSMRLSVPGVSSSMFGSPTEEAIRGFAKARERFTR